MNPFFSIIIPAYKNANLLEKVMDSVMSQTFTHFEVIISDDSPDDSVGELINTKYRDTRVHYFRNQVPRGTPENWNAGIRKAKGEWIKLLHDDDWFALPQALQQFSDAIKAHPECHFFHCNYENIFLDGGHYPKPVAGKYLKDQFRRNKFTLVSRNFIGPPSVVLVHRSIDLEYDANLKWLVDIDFYMQAAQITDFVYLPGVLVKVGVSKKQVTAYTHNIPEVEIPEALHVFKKWESQKPWKNIVYFDAWWRLMRNLNIRSLEQFQKFSGGQPAPAFVKRIIQVQRRFPSALLRNGPVSKMLMSLSFLFGSKMN